MITPELQDELYRIALSWTGGNRGRALELVNWWAIGYEQGQEARDGLE